MTIAEIIKRMVDYSEGDRRGVAHFLKVHAYAKLIGELEGLDEETRFILETAAVTHDIACPLCRKKYGNANGKLQESEGGPLVREFLAGTGLTGKQIDRVAWLVGHHHTLDAVQGLDHQILLEADYLVNADEIGYSPEHIASTRRHVFQTKTGLELLDSLYRDMPEKGKLRAFPGVKKKLGFGMMRLPMEGERVDIPAAMRMVDAFMQAGFNYFDTAAPYIDGQSETAINTCLTQRYPRGSFILTNKLSNGCFEKEEDIRPFFENQLKACGVEYFDFYLMHALNAKSHQKYQQTRAYDIAQELKAEGKIRHVGFSFHDSAEILDEILTDRPEMEVVQLQLNYLDWEDARVQSRACYEVCVKHGKPVIVMEPVKGGTLANLPERADGLMTNGSPASYAIRFAAGCEKVMMVLSGMSTLEQVQDNLSYMTEFRPLDAEEQAVVERVRAIIQEENHIPCTACRYCVEGCPAGIDIPAVFGAFNAKDGAGYAALEPKAAACLDCGACENICPQQLKIRELLKKADAKLK